MTEDNAVEWMAARFGEDAVARLAKYRDLLIDETQRQNLISATTLPHLWARHIVDSAQLLDTAPPNWQHWIDIGSGAGLPGIVVAILGRNSVTMVEPRRLRVAFLQRCIDELQLANVAVILGKAGAVDLAPANVISARAVAKLSDLLSMSQSFASLQTTYVLPKGESAQSEVANARRSWHGTFHVKQSIVDPRSGIVVATGVRPR